MWKQGKFEIKGKRYEYCAKVYDEGSTFGINGGRVSKLHVKREEDPTWQYAIVAYDRGWDVKPADSEARAAFEAALDWALCA